MNKIRIRNGLEIPQIGLGTWQLTDRDLLHSLLPKAYEIGYQLIDTAAAYSNEIAIGKAILDSGIPRDEWLLSDKVWNTNRGYKEVQEACHRSLKKLKTDYLDFYLIHWPASQKLHPDWEEINAESWRGMEALLKDGLVRVIGVCNFTIEYLEALEKTAAIIPLVNQIEYHPGINQKELFEYCQDKRIQIEASSPLGNGQILHNPVLTKIAEKKEKTVSQICLRWEAQKDLIMIPKTSKVERLQENLDIDNFILTEDEMKEIDLIPWCGGIGIDPNEGYE